MLETVYHWFLSAVALGIVLPISMLILFKAELKNLLYLKFKQHLIVRVDINNPDPINNFSLAAAYGTVSTEGDL